MDNLLKENLVEQEQCFCPSDDNSKPIGIFIKTEHSDSMEDDFVAVSSFCINKSKFGVKVEENDKVEVMASDATRFESSVKINLNKSDVKTEDPVVTSDFDPLDLCSKHTDKNFSSTKLSKEERVATIFEDKLHELGETTSHNQLSIPDIPTCNVKKHLHSESHVFDTCSLVFTQKDELEKHKIIHSDEKPLLCNQCDKQFKNKSQLVKHKRIHSGDKPYLCDVCEKTFTSTSNLTRHRRIHTGVKPFSCNFCEKLFTDASNLKKHQIVHKNEILGICK